MKCDSDYVFGSEACDGWGMYRVKELPLSEASARAVLSIGWHQLFKFYLGVYGGSLSYKNVYSGSGFGCNSLLLHFACSVFVVD